MLICHLYTSIFLHFAHKRTEELGAYTFMDWRAYEFMLTVGASQDLEREVLAGIQPIKDAIDRSIIKVDDRQLDDKSVTFSNVCYIILVHLNKGMSQRTMLYETPPCIDDRQSPRVKN